MLLTRISVTERANAIAATPEFLEQQRQQFVSLKTMPAWRFINDFLLFFENRSSGDSESEQQPQPQPQLSPDSIGSPSSTSSSSSSTSSRMFFFSPQRSPGSVNSQVDSEEKYSRAVARDQFLSQYMRKAPSCPSLRKLGASSRFQPPSLESALAAENAVEEAKTDPTTCSICLDTLDKDPPRPVKKLHCAVI